MKADFRDERGCKKFRVVSCTTIMMQEQRKAQKAEEREAKRLAKLQERNAKMNEGQLSLF